MTTYVALLRGINVGRAKRVAMADLRALVTELGFSGVRTLLNSGNVIFDGLPGATDVIASRIETGLVDKTGVSAKVTVLTASEVREAVEANGLKHLASDPSRFLFAFTPSAKVLGELDTLPAQEWSPEAIALGARTAYLWCPQGVLASRLPGVVEKTLGDRVTMRNLATVGKIVTLLEQSGVQG